MLVVNRNLYGRSIYNFIDASVGRLIEKTPGLRSTKEYWLFYYIKDDFLSNFSSLYNADIDQDFLGFPLIRRNTRHAIEAFLDLYNLCMDQGYMEVLKYCSGEQKNVERYKDYLHNGQFTIQSKCNIAKDEYGMNFQELVDIAKESNSYIHPNVFMNTISVEERAKKQEILKNLLTLNLKLFDKAYGLLFERFEKDGWPFLHLGCCNYLNCRQCHQNAYDSFYYCIQKQLLVEVPSSPVNFSK